MGISKWITDMVEKEQKKRKLKQLRRKLEDISYNLDRYYDHGEKEYLMQNYIKAIENLCAVAPWDFNKPEILIYKMCKDLLEKPKSSKCKWSNVYVGAPDQVLNYNTGKVKTKKKSGRPKGSKNKRRKK